METRYSYEMGNGKFFDGNRIEELIKFIINKFSEEKLTCAEAKIVLDKTRDLLGDYSLVQSTE